MQLTYSNPARFSLIKDALKKSGWFAKGARASDTLSRTRDLYDAVFEEQDAYPEAFFDDLKPEARDSDAEAELDFEDY
ncbi:hypothetical protein MMC13_004038 [Lambiella insularis]|nr:hypothetical protein [Lambiella insularis]